ncbi:SDR family NAD(P)-dependent oxidoreductase [Actinoplanes teichomyceticus]|uniref:Short-subunit dehydrogenase n=1 Tax=Actinoplanes teichomyceticus TaxID=1867 RepID=A0A561VLE1_ACTTI|nr:SDR family NAD(P)-dependent oxidoreductase [Actinoplanes teichomyceticus]TWG12435.1 short-subunit dehydrogenase [Actinoplanes teichomyceticus]GIF13796.1 short-chain dehydrogenase [Actinoplanes teichomyceticus]
MSTLDFAGRVAIVTGAGSGLGREYAKMLASRGARVVVNDLADAAATETVDIIRRQNGDAVADVHDVVTAAAQIVQSAIDAFGRLDIVVNNAGIVRLGAFAEMAPVQWWQVFDTHVKGTVEISRYAWKHLVASGTGRLINISSSGMLGEPLASAYAAAKAAVWGLGNAIRVEGDQAGVQVSTLHPTAWTAMSAGAFDHEDVRASVEQNLPAHAVAAFVTWLAHQDTTVHGETFQVSGNSAGRAVFAAAPRVRVDQDTPEAWAAVGDQLLRDAAEGQLLPLHSTSASLRRELVLLDPALDALLPTGTATPGNR